MPTPDPLLRSAHAAALGVVSPVVAKAALEALASVEGRTAATLTREVVADMAALSRASDWQATLDAVAKDALAVLSRHGADAMRWGYEAKMAEEVAALPVDFEWGPEDEALLAAYPVQGHTMAEHAAERSAALRFDLAGAVNAVAAQIGGPEAMTEKVQALALAFADASAVLVDEAWHAGQTAAVFEVGGALADLTGSAGGTGA